MKIVKYLTVLSLVIALTSCGSEEAPTTEAQGTETETTETADAGTEADETETTTTTAATTGNVVGTWKMDNYEMPAMAEMMAGMPAEQVAEIEKQTADALVAMKEHGSLAVNEDGSVVMTMVNMGTNEPEAQTGTWTMSEDSKTFTITMDGQAQAMEVIQLTDTNFDMSISAEGMTVNMMWVR